MSRAFLPHCSMIVLLLHWHNSAAPTQNKPHKNNEEWTCSGDRIITFPCLKPENKSTLWLTCEFMVEFGQRLDLVILKVFSTLNDSWFYGVTNLCCASDTAEGVVGQVQRRPLSCIPTNPGKDSFAQKKTLIVNPGTVSPEHFEGLGPKIVLT